MDRILVVDDDPALLRHAEDVLCEQYEVSLASSGEQALTYLEQGEQPILILLDILMPNMDGYETFAQIREIEGCASTPVIFLTSITEPEAEVRGLENGAVDYITKPFSAQVLLARVAVRIENAKQLRSGIELDEKKLAALPEPLTGAEMKVLRLMARSYTNEEISQELHYAYGYVKKLVSQVLGKLGIRSRNEVKNFRY